LAPIIDAGSLPALLRQAASDGRKLDRAANAPVTIDHSRDG